jgi:HEAT repeat protein
MEIIPGLIMPLWSIIVVIAAAAAVIVFFIIRIYLNYSFTKTCEAACADKEKMKLFRAKYSGEKLLQRSRLIEKLVEKNGISLISDINLDKQWETQFLVHRKIKYLKKFIKYFPEKGFFFCILGGKSKPAFEKFFKKLLEQNSDLNLLKRIAAAGDGNDFDGAYALSIFRENFQDIIEIAGDAEWQIRFFAIKMLIHSSEERAERIVWDAFRDSSVKIRKAAAAEFKTEDLKRLSGILKDLLLDDPAYAVRKAARIRLDADFPELYRIETASLTKSQTIHLLAHLHDGSEEDENTAFEFLLSENLEIRLQAALYLQKQGSLVKLFLKADEGDLAGYNRIKDLLNKACEVNCAAFLQELEHSENPATVHLAAGLLKTNGNREYIDRLASKVFTPSFREKTRERYSEIYAEAVECISLRGSDAALNMLNSELKLRYKEEPVSAAILPLIPLRGDSVFIPTLLTFLKKADFPDPALLRQTIERFPPSMYIEELINLLRSSPEEISPPVKKEAFKILGELKMPCCLQVILENLKLLTHAEQKEFAVILNSFDEEAFTERVSILMHSCDSETKSAIMSALPATGLKMFVKDIKDAAGDPDPEVRIASIWALAGYGEVKLISAMTDMLRDPVERVRKETAEVIAGYGTVSAMEELKNLLTDDNEVLPVKTAAIHGFGVSEREESIKILVDVLEIEELRPFVITALSKKTSRSEIKLLTELFKDAAPQLREYIATVFKAMGESCEAAVTSLLKEEIASLREILAEILLKTGYIENTVSKLRNRKPEVRKYAASILALIQTKEAFKGMVLAARDPDSEVRVEVLKALEKLNSPEGSRILEELKDDPDKRVRKYTLWALERIKAKNTNE